MLRYCILLICFLFSFQNFSQNFSDLSNINFSDLNNTQIDLLLRRAQAQGYSQFDLLNMAKDQGMDSSEINELDKKFKSTETISRVPKMPVLHWKILDLEKDGQKKCKFLEN